MGTSSTGILAHLLISGAHPFHRARSYADMVAAHVQHMPAPLSSFVAGVPVDVDALIEALTQKDPDRRYPDADAFAAQLRRAFRRRPGLA